MLKEFKTNIKLTRYKSMIETKNKNIKTQDNISSSDISKLSFLKSQKLLKNLKSSLSKEVINQRRNSK